MKSIIWKPFYAWYYQGRSDGGISVYIPLQNQSTLQIFMWLLVVVFFSLTQDKFDIVPVCALARVSFNYLHTTIYTPQMKFLATPLGITLVWKRQQADDYIRMWIWSNLSSVQTNASRRHTCHEEQRTPNCHRSTCNTSNVNKPFSSIRNSPATKWGNRAYRTSPTVWYYHGESE